MSSLSSSFKSIEGMPAITPTPVYSNILVGQPPVYVQCTGLTDLTDGESSQYCYNGSLTLSLSHSLLTLAILTNC
ncbi:unnamed protein product [Hymenolepis diminuta]|uniref:Uncharacterized protein n=1 Tax=Hymenolepis diminuta TaxID=6216 RepID=A0A564YN75_HYMDI|nr:unnamed protein product [Hymenolepis diminuta]